MITLPAHPAHDLNWDIDPEKEVEWFLDFGWSELDPFDSALLNANILAAEEFIKRVPNAKKVILAKLGKQLIKPSAQFDERSKESQLPKELYTTQLFSDYLHRIASVLPEQMEPVVVVEIPEEVPLENCILSYCRRRFEHLELRFTQKKLPIEGDASIIVSLPSDSLYNPADFKGLFKKLGRSRFKCIPEEFLNEHWEGVDNLIIDPKTLGEIGRRMLCGFEAAGGRIISTRGPLGFANEASLERFLSE